MADDAAEDLEPGDQGKANGMRPRRDIDDLDNLFDRDEAARRRQERAEMIETGQRRQALLDAQDVAAAARVKEFSLKANASFIAREYRAAGVAPPFVNGAGEPTCSLSFLLWEGWRVEDLGLGVRELVAPSPPPPWEGPRDRDSFEATRPKRKK